MAITHHPTIRQIIYIVLFVTTPALVSTCYFFLAERDYVEELFISVLVFLCSGGLCLFAYFSDSDEIAFCEEYEISEETFEELSKEAAPGPSCGGSGESGSDV